MVDSIQSPHKQGPTPDAHLAAVQQGHYHAQICIAGAALRAVDVEFTDLCKIHYKLIWSGNQRPAFQVLI